MLTHNSLIHSFIDSLTHWSVEPMIHWFIDLLLHCFIVSVSCWFISSLPLLLWFTDWLIFWFVDSLTHWFIESLNPWFIGLFNELCSMDSFISSSSQQPFAHSSSLRCFCAAKTFLYRPLISYSHVLFSKLPPLHVPGTIWLNREKQLPPHFMVDFG